MPGGGKIHAYPDLQNEHGKLSVLVQPHGLSQFSTSDEEVFEIPLDKEIETESDPQLYGIPHDIPSQNVPLHDIPDIPFPPNEESDNENIENTQTSNGEDTNNFNHEVNHSDDSDDNNPIPPDYFRIEEFQEDAQQLSRDNSEQNYFDREILSTPIPNYRNDKILQCDEEAGWKRPFPDDMPYQGPFMAKRGLKVEMETKQPEDFFNLMFDDRMFETIADETNQYARN